MSTIVIMVAVSYRVFCVKVVQQRQQYPPNPRDFFYFLLSGYFL